MPPRKTLTPDEIVDHIIAIVGVENDNQLADHLGVNRQNIYQFRKGKGENLTCKLFTIALTNNK